MLAQAVVHTTGINWEGVIATVASATVILGFLIALFARYVGNKITSAINLFRIQVVAQLDARLTTAEVKLNDIQVNMQRKR